MPITARTVLVGLLPINGLAAELRDLDRINRLVPGGDIRMHVLSLPDMGTTLGDEPSIKRTVDTALFESLRQRGYSAAEDWLQMHRDKLGVQSFIDIEARYLVRHACSKSSMDPLSTATPEAREPTADLSGDTGF